ncbi:MAG: GGDEF domain-containing protein [Ruminococcus sp.]|nr:GGDEF domain-containing protein [Ruminococcus sp.]HRR76657.1 bifunctional diguanylate cyclase/phosphodiesterase [Ruminococcus sp.]
MKNKEYLDAFEYFIDKMLAIPDTINIDVSDQLSRICDVLRISRMTVTIYDNYRLSDPDHRRTVVIYDKPPCDESCCIVRRNVTAAENAAVYSAWQRAGEDEWDEDEISSITRVLDLMFLFNGRSKLIKDAEKLIFFDHDMDIRNHKFYMRFIGQLCAQNKIGDYAAIFANLRRFSVINQQIGRENGNKVMQIFINKLKELMSDEELIARIGGDNFALIVRKGNLKRILNILEGTAITIDETYGERIMLSATAGVYVVPDNDSSISPSIIMDRISLASHIARASGKTDPVFFNQEIMNASQRVTSITADFPAAIAKKEFKVYYQPKVSLEGYTVAGAEALCRWIHNGRIITPDVFISVLERSMDICRLDFYMLGEVCSHIRKWLDAGLEPVRISVNLSRRHLSDIDLTKHILSIIDSYDVPHELIEIELTETTTDIELFNLKRIITELQKAGLYVSVDDFGIGYSSLNLIKEIPWNVLKLDKSLIPDLKNDPDNQNQMLFKYVIAMAQAMGLECIAEGVETPEQVAMLREYSCKLAQGYIFDKPLPKEEFEQRLSGHAYSI